MRGEGYRRQNTTRKKMGKYLWIRQIFRSPFTSCKVKARPLAIALQDRPSCTLPSHFNNNKKSRLKVLLIGRISLVTSWCRPTRNRRSRCVGCLHCVKKCCPSPRGFSRHFLLLSRTTSYAVFRYLFFFLNIILKYFLVSVYIFCYSSRSFF